MDGFYSKIIQIIRAYQTANGSYPEKIIVYRDGVGAGDIQTVLDIELEGIQVNRNLIKKSSKRN
jgi:aubergine-like protein